jgi:hypothetical protein
MLIKIKVFIVQIIRKSNNERDSNVLVLSSTLQSEEHEESKKKKIMSHFASFFGCASFFVLHKMPCCISSHSYHLSLQIKSSKLGKRIFWLHNPTYWMFSDRWNMNYLRMKQKNTIKHKLNNCGLNNRKWFNPPGEWN